MILIYTGAGKPGFPILTNKRIEKEWMNLFDPSRIKQTFAAFLGLYAGHEELLYSVPNDPFGGPDILLSISDEDIKEHIGFWGVFKHTHVEAGRRNFHNIEEVPDLTAYLFGGIYASSMATYIDRKYAKPANTNIVFFLSCRSAHKEGARTSDYSTSAAPFFAQSHYSRRYVPSGLNAHVPRIEDDAFHARRIVLRARNKRIPLDPKQRNVLVPELIAMLQTKYGVFAGATSLYLTPVEDIYVPLSNEVLFESQLKESYFRKELGEYILDVFPRFSATRNVSDTTRQEGYLLPENLETVEIARRAKMMKKTRRRVRR